DGGEDVVLLDEGAGLGRVARGVGGVVELGHQLDLPAEHAALLVDHVEVGLGPVEDRRVLVTERACERGHTTDADLVAADAFGLSGTAASPTGRCVAARNA